MSKEPRRNVYVGHRYVPKIMGEWDKSISYEGLSIVTYKGGSYTSKKRVPVGIDIKDTEFWAMTGNYNAQVEEYRKEVRDMQDNVTNQLDENNKLIEQVGTELNKKLSSIGLIANDKSKDKENLEKLINAFDKYNILVVDDHYYLDTDDRIYTDNNINLVGFGNGTLEFTGKGSKIVLSNQKLVQLRNLKIKGGKNPSNKDGQNTRIFTTDQDNPNSRIDKFIVENCTFENSIELLWVRGAYNTQGTNETTGVNTLIFNNNTVLNNNLRARFISFNNASYKNVWITNNNINNFDYVFFRASDFNDPDSEIDGISLSDTRENLHVYNNVVINDDDWWHVGGISGYHAFIIVKSKNVFYNNNHVEGLHRKDDGSVYDAYLSCDYVEYTNNTWKNNICFNDDPSRLDTNTLFRAKSSGIKICKNNNFIVEKEYAEKFNESLENLRVVLYDFMNSSTVDYFIFKDNLVDCYGLQCTTARTGRIKQVIFDNNIFKANDIHYPLVKNTTELNYDYEKYGKIIITNNTITAKSEMEYRGVSRRFRLLESTEAPDSIDHNKDMYFNEITISNNIVNAPITFIARHPKAVNLNVINNQINIPETTIQSFKFIYESFIKGNDIVKDNFLNSNRRIGNVYLMEMNGNIYHENKGKGFLFQGSTDLPFPRMKIDPNNNELNYEKTYFFESVLTYGTEIKKINFSFTYGYDQSEKRNYIRFIKENGDEIKSFINKDSNDDYGSKSIGFYINGELNNPDNSDFRLLFSQSLSYVYFSRTPNNEHYALFNTKIYNIDNKGL